MIGPAQNKYFTELWIRGGKPETARRWVLKDGSRVLGTSNGYGEVVIHDEDAAHPYAHPDWGFPQTELDMMYAAETAAGCYLVWDLVRRGWYSRKPYCVAKIVQDCGMRLECVLLTLVEIKEENPGWLKSK